MSHTLQLYYTSCREGLSGYSGFQVLAESDGMSPEDSMEIQSAALYRPPRDLPGEPDQTMIDQLFPKAFRAFSLCSGRIAVMRTVYTGQDYSRRWGNFFTHAVVLPPGDFWPVDVLGWDGWVGAPPETGMPGSLAEISLPELVEGSPFSFNELSAFLREDKSRPEMLQRMLCAVLNQEASGKSLLIRENCDRNSILWVACIQKAFPPASHHLTSFSTFQFDPGSALAVNATRGETDFLFDDRERRFQFSVADFATGIHTLPDDPPSDYAGTLAYWMAFHPDRVEAFHRRAGELGAARPGPELEMVLMICRLENGEQPSMTFEERRDLLAFVRRRLSPELLNSTGEALAFSMDLSASTEEWVTLIKQLADSLPDDESGQATLRRAWLEAFGSMVKRDGEGVDALNGLLRELTAFRGNGLARQFLSRTHMKRLTDQVPETSLTGLKVVAGQLRRFHEAVCDSPFNTSSELEEIIHAYGSVGADWSWLFTSFGDDPSAMVCLAELVSQMARDDTGGHTEAMCRLGRSLAGVAPDEAARYRLLDTLKSNPALHEMLYWEWEASLGSDPVSAHLEYRRMMLSDDSAYARRYRFPMLEELLRTLPAGEARMLSVKLVVSGLEDEMPEGTAVRLLDLAAAETSLSPEDEPSGKLAEAIETEWTGRSLPGDHPRLLLRRELGKAIIGDSGTLKVFIDKVPADCYLEAAASVLSIRAAGAASREGYGSVIESLARADALPELTTAVVHRIAERTGRPLEKQESFELLYWADPSRNATHLVKDIREPVLSAFRNRFAGLSRRERRSAAATLRNLSRGTPPEVFGVLAEITGTGKHSWVRRLLSGAGKEH